MKPAPPQLGHQPSQQPHHQIDSGAGPRRSQPGDSLQSAAGRSGAGKLVPGFVLLALAAILAATPVRAAAQRSQDRILAEIRQIQAQLASLTEENATLAQAVRSLLADREAAVADERRSRAETASALQRMERTVARLSESFSDTGDRLATLLVEVESIREAQRQAALAAVAVPMDDAIADTAEASPSDPGEEAGGASAGPGATPSNATESGAGGAVVLDAPSVTDIYMEAEGDYLQGRYDLAVAGYERVAESGGELADNAWYRIGEAHLATDRLEPAMQAFETVIQDYPDSNRHGDAWFKKGVILYRLGHESDAREIFEDIVDLYAGTQAALAAQRELAAMPPREPGR